MRGNLLIQWWGSRVSWHRPKHEFREQLPLQLRASLDQVSAQQDSAALFNPLKGRRVNWLHFAIEV